MVLLIFASLVSLFLTLTLTRSELNPINIGDFIFVLLWMTAPYLLLGYFYEKIKNNSKKKIAVWIIVLGGLAMQFDITFINPDAQSAIAIFMVIILQFIAAVITIALPSETDDDLNEKKQEKIENNGPIEIFEETKQKTEIKKYIIAALVFLVVIFVITIFKIYDSKYSKSGLYDLKANEYVNKKFDFKINVPYEWKKYTVQEAISCPYIKKDYADDYYLLASPTADYNETLFVVNKASLSPDYFTNSPMDQVREQIKGKGIDENMVIEQNPGIMDEQKKYESEMATYKKLNINGFTVYRKNYEVADVYREDNYFVSNGSLINVFYYVQKSEGESSEIMKQMREVFDKTLTAI